MSNRIAVIGGGASGLMAAITAARNGAEVTVYEVKERLGKKILATGNGKCNYTNLVQTDDCYRGENPSFSKTAREAFPVEETLRFFKGIGIEPKIKNGYVYPNSEQAASVADALVMELRGQRVSVVFDKVCHIKQTKTGFLVSGEKGEAEFSRVILCCGSCAGMKNKSDFSGYGLAEQLGHHVTPIFPALVQLRCREKWFKTISGVRTEGVVTVLAKGKKLAEERGELLFADYGLSGIPVFQVSRFAGDALNNGQEVTCSIDLLPGFTLTELEELLRERCQTLKYRTAEEILTGLLNHKLNYILLKECGIDPTAASEKAFRSNAEITRLAGLYKKLTCHVTELNPFANAQVCAGGVDTKELVPETLESRLVKGLYMAGELIDIDGTCGGYNLQWAWSSGYMAGLHAATDK